MKLKHVPGDFSIARYAHDTVLPALHSRRFCTITRTENELCVVCETDLIPPGASQREDGWACLKVDGILDFSLTGILAKISGPLANAELSIFAVSTFDTDYVLLKKEFLIRARAVLNDAGILIT